MKLKRRYKWLNIERNNKFVNRILFLSIPSALVLLVLAIFNIVSPLIAVLTYAAILVFNSALLLPINFELQQLKKYTSSLASGENFDEKDMPISPKETKEIIKSINAMHRFWAQKTDDLEAQSISDAAVLDTLPDPIMMIDRAGNIIGANLSSRNLFGRKITDKNIEKLFDSNNFIEAVNRVLKKESEAENLIFYIHKPLYLPLPNPVPNLRHQTQIPFQLLYTTSYIIYRPMPLRFQKFLPQSPLKINRPSTYVQHPIMQHLI